MIHVVFGEIWNAGWCQDLLKCSRKSDAYVDQDPNTLLKRDGMKLKEQNDHRIRFQTPTSEKKNVIALITFDIKAQRNEKKSIKIY